MAFVNYTIPHYRIITSTTLFQNYIGKFNAVSVFGEIYPDYVILINKKEAIRFQITSSKIKPKYYKVVISFNNQSTIILNQNGQDSLPSSMLQQSLSQIYL